MSMTEPTYWRAWVHFYLVDFGRNSSSSCCPADSGYSWAREAYVASLWARMASNWTRSAASKLNHPFIFIFVKNHLLKVNLKKILFFYILFLAYTLNWGSGCFVEKYLQFGQEFLILVSHHCFHISLHGLAYRRLVNDLRKGRVRFYRGAVLEQNVNFAFVIPARRSFDKSSEKNTLIF